MRLDTKYIHIEVDLSSVQGLRPLGVTGSVKRDSNHPAPRGHHCHKELFNDFPRRKQTRHPLNCRVVEMCLSSVGYGQGLEKLGAKCDGELFFPNTYQTNALQSHPQQRRTLLFSFTMPAAPLLGCCCTAVCVSNPREILLSTVDHGRATS